MKSEIYPNIRHLREDSDMTQAQLAKALNVAQNTYSQYECGVIALTAGVPCALAEYYNVSADYLLGRTHISAPYDRRD